MFGLHPYTRVYNIFVLHIIPSFPVLNIELVYSIYKRVLASSKALLKRFWTKKKPNFFVTSEMFRKWMQIIVSSRLFGNIFEGYRQNFVVNYILYITEPACDNLNAFQGANVMHPVSAELRQHC